MYTDGQRQNVHLALRQMRFQNPSMQQFAEAEYMTSDDVTRALEVARKLIQSDNPDTENARSLLQIIKAH